MPGYSKEALEGSKVQETHEGLKMDENNGRSLVRQKKVVRLIA